ncbi:type VI secretion system tip protein VgrG [Archangium violaceum]|uniref:type VI secretion system Vgr family protein n=1 Tax=Archangium violaceum TaxID=83451 RepID=UPI00193C1C4C|nr:type VI secretion system tip protein VgrG [Archangium violaceum]QRK09837.1 type VI secretion system tip protein VgrG [Archangium violaceum]
MSGPGSSAFSLKAGQYGAGELVVGRFAGTEGLSRLYEFQVEFHHAGAEPLETADVLGTQALLTLEVPGASPRYVHGRVCAVEALGSRGGHERYRLWMVPGLWWLKRVARSRIFQGKSVPDIIKAVLGEAGVKARWALSGSYETREYCTQYRETDFAFISRLMEWEGLFYFFEHTEDGHTLVVGDKPTVHEPLPGGATLSLRDNDGRVAEGEYLVSLERAYRLRPGRVHLKDFDFEKPALDVSGRSNSDEGLSGLEVYDYPGEYVTPGVGKQTARVRLEEAVQAARTLQGESVAPRLTAGYRFEVEDDGTNAGEYTVVEVRHMGAQPETPGGREALGGLYRNHFRCMPARVPYRPRRLTPMPSIAGVQTATVVGPSGEEIHTDEHGRIKVQFHWDREGQRDDKASCWVRVGQTWGGLAWGALYLPRIGQEVVVRFLEGNPDRPLIAGTVYNGGNPTPYALPDDKTKSTLKSASSLGSDGFNEFRIEDAAGEEEIFVHGQKDEDLVTENDKAQEVKANEDLLVKKDRQRTVEGNQKLSVLLDDDSRVEGNQTLQVRGNRSTSTSGSHSESVEGNQSISVAKNVTASISQAASESVGAARALTVGAGYAINVALALNEAVGGLKSTQVAAAYTEYVEGSRQEMVAKDKETKVGRDFQTEIEGGLSLVTGKDETHDIKGETVLDIKDATAWLAKAFELKADKFSLVVGGNLILQMEKSGSVKLFAKTLTIDSSNFKAKGSKVKLEPAGSLKSGSGKKADIQKLDKATPKSSVVFQTLSTGGESLEGKEFELKLSDGSTRKGKMDATGKVQVDDVKPGKVKLTFPEKR